MLSVGHRWDIIRQEPAVFDESWQHSERCVHYRAPLRTMVLT